MTDASIDFRKTHFVISAPDIEHLEQYVAGNQGIEIAFAGRSNAGKSSALNALTEQKNLARTSKTPGRTQLINVFETAPGCRLVDLPGYGFAQVPLAMKKKWQQALAEYLQHREVYRPWGTHDEIAEGERFHVKHVMVKPGERTATQMHYHRAEHWVVVKGTAKVINGDKSYLLTENESTYIPIGSPHSIANPGQIPLELIEVRSGAYLSEDDVVRVEDYGVGY